MGNRWGAGDVAGRDAAGHDMRKRLARLGIETVAVALGVAAIGRVITGPLGGMPAEDVVNERLAAHGSPLLDRLTWMLSTYSDTVPTIVTALGVGVWRWRSDGRLPRAERIGRAVQPIAAISIETAAFMTAAACVGRERPRVRRLDKPAPTSSFPSGHTGASTSLHRIVADDIVGTRCDAGGLTSWSVSVALPALVGWSRLYRGMHHPSDVVVGLAVGAWAASAARRATR